MKTPGIPEIDRPTTVYRLLDADGELLYVGVSVDVFQRLATHKYEQWWWSQVATISFEEYRTRSDAEQRERQLIRDEFPIHNVVKYLHG